MVLRKLASCAGSAQSRILSLRLSRPFHCFGHPQATATLTYCGPVRTVAQPKDPWDRHDVLTFAAVQIRCYASKNLRKDRKGPKVVELGSEELDGVIDLKEYEDALKNLVEEFRDQLAKQFVVRTSAATFENIVVELDGKKSPLNEIAQITFKTPQLIMINLSSTPKYVQPVVAALNASGLNLNPQVEGHIVCLAVPKVSRDHREALAKGAKAAWNKSKDRMRHVQNNYIKQAKIKEDVSADLIHNVVQKLMQLADQYARDLESSLLAKQKDLLGTEDR